MVKYKSLSVFVTMFKNFKLNAYYINDSMLRVEILWQQTVLHQELYIKSQPDRK